MNPTERRIAGAHGLTLNLLEWSRDGRPLLLLHGFGHSARVWDPVAPVLASRYRVLALDARGHGDSDHDPEFRYSHSAVTRDVEAVVDELGIERFALVGHSMGGYASIRYAARHPDKIMKLVLIDAGPELSAASRAGRGERREPPDASFASASDYATVLARMHPHSPAAHLEHLARHWLREREDGRLVPKLDPAFIRPKSASDPENRRSFDRARWAREEAERLRSGLREISCPTLVVRGERSRMLSADTVEQMVSDGLRDGRSLTIEGAGHAVPVDAPQALADAVAGFLLGA